MSNGVSTRFGLNMISVTTKNNCESDLLVSYYCHICYIIWLISPQRKNEHKFVTRSVSVSVIGNQ